MIVQYKHNCVCEREDIYKEWLKSKQPSVDLCRGVRPDHPHPNKCPGYDIKQSDCKSPALENWGIWSTPSLRLLSSPL